MSNEPLFTPPAIVREAQPLAELAAQINACIAAGLADTKNALVKFREAGAALIRAKGRLEHGQWLPWLEKNIKYSRRTASQYMRLERDWSKWEAASHLDNALRVLVEDAEEFAATPTVATSIVYCRDCRVRGPKPDCKACAELVRNQREHSPTGSATSSTRYPLPRQRKGRKPSICRPASPK